MRPLFGYIVIAASAAFIAMFFVCQRSEHVRIGYELTRLRRDRSQLIERARQLDFEVSRAASHDALLNTAQRLGLSLRPPTASVETAGRGNESP